MREAAEQMLSGDANFRAGRGLLKQLVYLMSPLTLLYVPKRFTGLIARPHKPNSIGF